MKRPFHFEIRSSQQTARSFAALVASLIAFVVPSTSLLAQTVVRQLALTHSGAYDFYHVDDQPAGDSLYPYVTRMARAAGHTYLLDGTFGPQFNPSNPGGDFVRQVTEVTQDNYLSQWTRESNTPLEIDNVPGATLADKAYTSLMFSPRNFVGYWFDESTGQLIVENGVPQGINPRNDPAGFQALVDEYVAAINVFARRVPGATIHIYESLPPAFAFPFTEDETRDNTIGQGHIDNYVNYSLGLYQEWLDDLADGIRNDPQLENGVSIVTVPINRVISELLRDHPELWVGRDWFDFARDGAPHFGDVGGSSDVFEAFLAPVLYGVLFGEAVPSGFTLEPGNIFESDFPMIRTYIATALNSPNGGGSGPGDPSDPSDPGSGGDPGSGTYDWAIWEDDSPDWTITNGANFNPTTEGLPAPANTSVTSLWSDTSEATLQFQGEGVRVYGLVFPNGVTGEIYLNDSLVASPSWSATPAAAGTLLWESGALPRDVTHTLRIRSTGDWVAIDYVEIFTDQPGSSGPGGGDPVDPGDPGDPTEPEPPATPSITRPNVPGSYEFIVASDGSGISDSIQAAVNAALPGDTIRVRPGTYPESVTLATSNLTLIAEGAVNITGFPNATHGIRIDADDVEVRGFTVSGIHGYAFPSDHAATGFVINAARTRLINCVGHSNGFKGFLILPAARDVLLQGGSAYDNSAAGIGIAGGTGITIRGMVFYSTGADGGADGTFQPTAILSDNWGDYDGTISNIIPLDGIQPITDLTIDSVTVYDHPDYGIRISAYNDALSGFPSGRIATTNLTLTNSHIYNNGSRLSNFVGGLYHLGGVLIQHVDGGLVAGNLMENNYFWGIDAYRCNDVVYRDNWFINNNRGGDTPGVTFEPVNVEINGGLRNVFRNNLIYGGYSGLFISWIPDSGDFDFFGPDSITVEENVIAGHIEGGLSMVMNNSGLSSRTVRNNLVEMIPAIQIDYLREDHNLDLLAPGNGNIIGRVPGFADAANGDFTLLPDSPLQNNTWGPANLRPSAPAPSGGFDAWIRTELGQDAPAADLLPNANADGDERPNLIDYATGGRANQRDADAVLRISPGSGSTATITLTLRADDPALAYTLRHSTDLQDWATAAVIFDGGIWRTDSASITVQTVADLGNGLWRLALRASQASTQHFAVLSVALPST